MNVWDIGRKVTKHIALLALAVLALLAGVFFYVKPVETDLPKSEAVQEVYYPPTPEEVLRLVNEERAKVGVAPLVLDERLTKSAQLKADDMTVQKYYDHVSPQGKQGYSYIFENLPGVCKYASENLFKMFENKMASHYAIEGWLGSPAHREAMLDTKYSITGVAISGTNIVQHFCETK